VSDDFRHPAVRRAAGERARALVPPRTAAVFAALVESANAGGYVRVSLPRLAALAGLGTTTSALRHLSARHLPKLYAAGLVERWAGGPGDGRGHIGSFRLALPVDNPGKNPSMVDGFSALKPVHGGSENPSMVDGAIGKRVGENCDPPSPSYRAARERHVARAAARIIADAMPALDEQPSLFDAPEPAVSMPTGPATAAPVPSGPEGPSEAHRGAEGLTERQRALARARAVRLGWVR